MMNSNLYRPMVYSVLLTVLLISGCAINVVTGELPTSYGGRYDEACNTLPTAESCWGCWNEPL